MAGVDPIAAADTPLCLNVRSYQRRGTASDPKRSSAQIATRFVISPSGPAHFVTSEGAQIRHWAPWGSRLYEIDVIPRKTAGPARLLRTGVSNGAWLNASGVSRNRGGWEIDDQALSRIWVSPKMLL